MVFAGSALTSCSEFLDPDNRSNIDVSYFETNPSAMLTYSYNNLKELYDGNGLVSLFVNGTDLYIGQAHNYDALYNSYKLTADDSKVQSLYTSAYNAINNANGVVYYSSDKNSKAASEARFVRGLCYYLLTQHFGSVPYITEYITSSARSYPRTPLNEVYDGILSDLEDVYNNGALDAEDHSGHASKRAVAALIAKVALAAGWDLQTSLTSAETGGYSINGTSYFAQAEQWATKAINGQALTYTYEEKWSPANDNDNEEEFFSVQYDRATATNTQKDGNGWQNNFSGYYETPTAKGQKHMTHANVANKKMIQLYEEGDERWDATFMTTMYAFDKATSTWGTEGYYAYYNAADPSKLGIAYRFLPPYSDDSDIQADFAQNGKAYAAGKAEVYVMGTTVKKYVYTASTTSLPTPTSMEYYTDASSANYSGYLAGTVSGMPCKKWDDPQTEQITSTTAGFRDVVILHLSDIYLVRAEAKLMQGKAYLDDVNAVRARSNAPAINSLASYAPAYSHSFTLRDIDIILDERALELFGEGKRWEDLRRTKQLVLYNKEFNNDYDPVSMGVSGGNIKWLRPIPATEIGSNDGISAADQNPGY